MKIIRTATVALSLDLLLKGQLSFLAKKNEVIAIAGEDDHLKTVAAREQVRVIPVTMQRAIRPFHDFVSLIKLFFVLRKEKPTLVHSITPKAGLLTMTAAWLAGVPIRIHTFTGLIFPYRSGFMFKLLKMMDTFICRFATHIIAEGNGVKELLVQHSVTTKPIAILAHGNVNGIDVDFFSSSAIKEDKASLREKFGIMPSATVFVFVGRLVKDKGIVELVEAFEELYANNKTVQLVLVGPLESDLDPLPAALLDKIQNHPNIHLMGYQSDVRPFLKMADCLVLPSYREGFPNVVLQAGAMELPCIVTDIPGCNEVIIPDENGWIVPSKNGKALSLAMAKFCEVHEMQPAMAQKARKEIVSKFTHELVWNATAAFYEQCEKERNV